MSVNALHCPGCDGRMQALRLPGRHQAETELDHCTDCGSVWFEPLELGTLDRRAWVTLLQALAANPRPVPGSAAAGRCLRCQSRLQATSLVTPHGRAPMWACPAGHGHLQACGALLASRGLFRPLMLAERVALATEARERACLHCGAGIDGAAEQCAFCTSPALVVDLPLLALALGLRDAAAAAAEAPPARDDAPLQAWACHACGQALDPTREPACTSCGHPVLAPALHDLLPLLREAARRLDIGARMASNRALPHLRSAERLRVAQLTRRNEHRATADRLEGAFWRRFGVLAGITVAGLLLVWGLS